MIQSININELIDSNKDYLVFQGCGGALKEWFDGINDMLLDEKIIKEKVEKMYFFQHNNLTNIAIPLDNMDLGKLAIVRLKWREVFGTMWFSDEGGSFNKIMYVCPICEGEYDFAHKCDICGEYYTTFELHYNPDNKSYICDKCENEMEEFE